MTDAGSSVCTASVRRLVGVLPASFRHLLTERREEPVLLDTLKDIECRHSTRLVHENSICYLGLGVIFVQLLCWFSSKSFPGQ